MHHDLAGLLENPEVVFTEPQIKCYMIQLLEGTKYLHEVTLPPVFKLVWDPSLLLDRITFYIET